MSVKIGNHQLQYLIRQNSVADKVHHTVKHEAKLDCLNPTPKESIWFKNRNYLEPLKGVFRPVMRLF